MKELISGPIPKRDVWQKDLPEEHILNRYSRQALEIQRRSIDEVSPEAFGSFCRLLCDPNRRIVITGGCTTGTRTQYLYLHLQKIRPDVKLMSDAASWTHDLLEVRQGDVLMAPELRRYENTTLLIGQLCHERGAEVVRLTRFLGYN